MSNMQYVRCTYMCIDTPMFLIDLLLWNSSFIMKITFRMEFGDENIFRVHKILIRFRCNFIYTLALLLPPGIFEHRKLSINRWICNVSECSAFICSKQNTAGDKFSSDIWIIWSWAEQLLFHLTSAKLREYNRSISKTKLHRCTHFKLQCYFLIRIFN